MRNKLLIGLLVVVLVAGGVAVAALRFLAAAEDEAIAYVPEDAFFYANVFLDPSNGQKLAIEDLLKKFPQAGTLEEAGDTLGDLFDRGLNQIGLTFDRDVEPWLGEQVAIFFTAREGFEVDPEGAALIGMDDADAAADAIDKALEHTDTVPEEKSYEGVDYSLTPEGDPATAFGFVDSFLVLGTEAGFQSVVDARDGDPLGDSPRFERATEQLERDRLALVYFDFRPFLEEARASGEIPPQLPPDFFNILERPAVMIAYARSDAIVFETATAVPDEGVFASALSFFGDAGNIGELPAESWAAATIPGLGDTARELFNAFTGIGVPGLTRAAAIEALRAETGLDLVRHVFSWPEDVGLFVLGTNVAEIGGGAVIESKDPQASSEALLRLELLLRRGGARVEPLEAVSEKGFALVQPGFPPINFIDAGRRVLVTVGDEAARSALSPDRSLSESPAFKEAEEELGDEFAIAFFLDVDPVLALADSMGASSVPAYRDEVKPFLTPLGFVAAGSRLEGDTLVQRFVIGVP